MLLTVALTVALVVVLDQGARGYVLGNYAASAVVLARRCGCWRSRGRAAPTLRGREMLAPLLRFGAPTVPADAAVFALNVVDRAYLLRADSPAAAGLYSVAVKLATAVIVAVRGFQAAWPPLAYSIVDEAQARAAVRAGHDAPTWSSPALVVAGFTLLGRWVVRLLAADAFYAAHEALPWVALGWALYGLFLVFVTIAGRAKVTTRTFPAAAAGLAVNVDRCSSRSSTRSGSPAPGSRLCLSYVAMLAVVHVLTRRLFPVPFERARIARRRRRPGGGLGRRRAAAPDERRRGLRRPRRRARRDPAAARRRARRHAGRAADAAGRPAPPLEPSSAVVLDGGLAQPLAALGAQGGRDVAPVAPRARGRGRRAAASERSA